MCLEAKIVTTDFEAEKGSLTRTQMTLNELSKNFLKRASLWVCAQKENFDAPRRQNHEHREQVLGISKIAKIVNKCSSTLYSLWQFLEKFSFHKTKDITRETLKIKPFWNY